MCSWHLRWGWEGLLTSSRSWSGYHHRGPPSGLASPDGSSSSVVPLHLTSYRHRHVLTTLSFDLCPTVVLEVFSFLFTFPPLQLLGTSLKRLVGTSGPLLPAPGRASFQESCLPVQPGCVVLFPGMMPHLRWGTSYLSTVSCKIPSGQRVSGLPLQISIPLFTCRDGLERIHRYFDTLHTKVVFNLPLQKGHP